MKTKRKFSNPKDRIAPKNSPLPRLKIVDSGVSFELDAKTWGRESIMGAAYMLTDRAFASLEGDLTGKTTVFLKPKNGSGKKDLKALADVFERELHTQMVRWAIAKNNLPVREYIAEQAILLANGSAPAAAPPVPAPGPSQPVADQLTDEQRQEIERLIAEVEDEIKAMNQKKSVPDPQNIKASWEEKQETLKSPGNP